jgi:hypothetical protein
VSGSTGTSGNGRAGRSWVQIFGALILIDFLLVLVMLATDMNLQTDFGTSARYFAHWYGLLAEGILDLLVALAVLGNATMPSMWNQRPGRVKKIVTAALVWVILAIFADLAIVFSWQQVGFTSMNQFAMYLFDTASPASGGYIPWLYDALLAAYIVTAVVGVLAWTQVRKWGSTPVSA